MLAVGDYGGYDNEYGAGYLTSALRLQSLSRPD